MVVPGVLLVAAQTDHFAFAAVRSVAITLVLFVIAAAVRVVRIPDKGQHG